MTTKVLTRAVFTFLLVFCLFSSAALAQQDNQKQKDRNRRNAPFVSDRPFTIQNRIDKQLQNSLKRRNIEPATLCSDEVFVRRVYLDLLGTLPTPEEVRVFLEADDKQKRRELIETLLTRPEFVDFQTMRWCDLLRVKAEFPINLWPNGAACYYRWIHRSVAENKPYDQFVREMVTANGSSFRDGPANFYRAVPSKDADTLAETVCLTFLEIDTGPWPQEKRKALAVFFSRVAYKETAQWKEEIVYWNRTPLESHRAMFPNGIFVTLEPDHDPRRAFADWLVSPENDGFNRTAVNRVWTWLFGSGLIAEPADANPEDAKFGQTQLPQLHPELLDDLCSELVKSKYDLKHLYRLILNSSTYQQSSLPNSEHPEAAALFASYPIRRIEAEVLQDMLAQIFDLPIGYVSEVPEPFTYVPPRYRTILLPDSSISNPLLEMFGRASRDTGTPSDRNNGVTESQQLFFLNSTEVNTWISRYLVKYRNLGKRPQVYKNMLDELWLTFLSRYPTEHELQIVTEELQREDKNGPQKLQDILWSVLNTTEFLCKH